MGVVRGEMREQSQNSPGLYAIQCRSAVQVLVNLYFVVGQYFGQGFGRGFHNRCCERDQSSANVPRGTLWDSLIADVLRCSTWNTDMEVVPKIQPADVGVG